MAKKQETDPNIHEIKKKMEDKKVIFGATAVIKNIKSGKVTKVFVTQNCSKDVKDDIMQLKKLADFEVVEIIQTNVELGDQCKKAYNVSVVAIIR